MVYNYGLNQGRGLTSTQVIKTVQVRRQPSVRDNLSRVGRKVGGKGGGFGCVTQESLPSGGVFLSSSGRECLVNLIARGRSRALVTSLLLLPSSFTLYSWRILLIAWLLKKGTRWHNGKGGNLLECVYAVLWACFTRWQNICILTVTLLGTFLMRLYEKT